MGWGRLRIRQDGIYSDKGRGAGPCRAAGGDSRFIR